MKHLQLGMAATCAGLMVIVSGCGPMSADKDVVDQEQLDSSTDDERYVLDHTMQRIDGTAEDLSVYEGQVVLIVNVASECGLTPQYAKLQSLYEAKKDEGFVVLGFPANDFMGQEPGTNEEIAQFCSREYSVTFPMFAKIAVKGEARAPLYEELVSQPEPIGGDPDWNFTKFLVDRQGRVVGRFGPRVSPEDGDLVAEIDRLLAADG